MSHDPADILKETLELPIESRAALTDSLLDSLDPEEVDEDVEAAWQREIHRRLHELDSHQVTPQPWDLDVVIGVRRHRGVSIPGHQTVA
jgi:putative addiction module component (TIGR02574 family)